MLRLVTALFMSFLLLACAEENIEEEATRVVYIPVLKDNVTIYGEFVGRTRASERIEVNARVDGFLEEISFIEENVRPMDVLNNIALDE